MGQVLNEISVIYSAEDSLERNKQELVYLDYIKDHINNVHKAYEMYMLPLLELDVIPCTLISTEELKQAIENNRERIDHHDDSKFGEEEFDGYRAHFHPTEAEKLDDDLQAKVAERFENECWVHHYTVNDHHPEHWVDKETQIAKDMTLDAIIEMLCDWEAMSMKFEDIMTWYETKGNKKQYSENTKRIVEDLLYNVLHAPVKE